MYRTVYYMISGDNEKCSYYLIQTLEIAGVIALAIFIVGTLFNIIKKNYEIVRKGKRQGGKLI